MGRRMMFLEAVVVRVEIWVTKNGVRFISAEMDLTPFF